LPVTMTRRDSANSRESASSGGDATALSSNLEVPHASKYGDSLSLADTARSKFQKGLECTSKQRYKLARSKFRAALKARILLHRNARHLNIAPVHEMLGMVEWKLGNYEGSRLHLGTALEICEEALAKLEDEEFEWLCERKGEGDSEGKDRASIQSWMTLEGMEMLQGVEPDLAAASNGATTAMGEWKRDNEGGVDFSLKRPPTHDEQVRMFRTNVERIHRTIDVMRDEERRNEMRVRKEEDEISSPYKNRRGLENDDGSGGGLTTRERAAVAESTWEAVAAAAIGRPSIERMSAEEIVDEAMADRRRREEEREMEREREIMVMEEYRALCAMEREFGRISLL